METDEVQVKAEQYHAKIKALEDNVKQLQNQVAGLSGQVAALEHRNEGLYKAVGKWRVKDEVDASDEKPKLVMAERKCIVSEWVYLEHIVIPVENNPHLARDAWNWLEYHAQTNQTKYIERIYYHEKHG
ncbi:MAG: hypothetical protein ABSC17_04365 [Thermacetogeniaceae bacterium]